MEKKDIEKLIRHKVEEAVRWSKKNLPRLVGREAVAHFKENFRKEGFMDGGLQKWKEVKRRDPTSPWYGFDYKGEKRTHYAFRRNKQTGKTYKANKQKRLNFSKAATLRPILTGKTRELQDSLRYVPTADGVLITSDKPYAAVQNDGGLIRIFGKKAVRLPARPFVGDSKELNGKIDRIIQTGIDKILNND